MRTHACDLIRDLAHARDLADALASSTDLSDDYVYIYEMADGKSTLKRHIEGARGIVSALEPARMSAQTLVRDRGAAFADALIRDLHRALELSLGFARDLSSSTNRLSHSLTSALGVMVENAFGLAGKLVDRLHTGEIDASGADLSALDLTDMSVLEGIVWTEETTWPPGVRKEVRQQSREIRPGVYRVRGGDERDPSELIMV